MTELPLDVATRAIHDLDCDPDCRDDAATYGRYARYARAALDAVGHDELRAENDRLTAGLTEARDTVAQMSARWLLARPVLETAQMWRTRNWLEDQDAHEAAIDAYNAGRPAAGRWVEHSGPPGNPAQVVAAADMIAAVRTLPEDPRPRVWALQAPPGPEVTRLTTPCGRVLERAGGRVNDGLWCDRKRGSLWTWPEALAEFRTLTDATGDADPTEPPPNLTFPTGRPGWLGTGQPWPCGACGQEVDDETRHDCQPRGSEPEGTAAEVADERA